MKHKYRATTRLQDTFDKPGMMPINPATAYAGNPDLPGYGDLVQAVTLFDGGDSGAGTLIRRSTDNGRTWTDQSILDPAYTADTDGSRMKKLGGDCFYDEDAKAMVLFSIEMLWENGKIDSVFRKRRLYYRMSFDNGFSWTNPVYIHKDAPGYDKDHMFPGFAYGRNMVMAAYKVIKLRAPGPKQGHIVLSTSVQMVDEAGQLINPTRWGFFQSGCLLGSWDADRSQYVWEECSSYASVSVEQSTRGVFEPAVQELPDGRLIMVMRGSNSGRVDDLPGTKWISYSEDQGMTWSTPDRLQFDNGQRMYSSSSLPALVRDADGAIHYVGNIAEHNPNGNLPRYPLCIAEIDPVTLHVRADSATVLDTINEQQELQAEEGARYMVDFSNHYVYLDRSGSTLVVYAPNRTNLHVFDAKLNRYEIELEQQR